MFRAPRRFAAFAAFVLVVAACSGTTTSGTPSASNGEDGTVTTAGSGAALPGSPSAAAVSEPLTLDEAVAALDDPATAVQGILGILAELNIGVYTADGDQVLAGSETGPDDLYVLAELLPGLAASARSPGPTMEQYLTDLEELIQTGLTPAELAAAYTVMTETLPDHPMSRVLRELSVDFDPETRLTRFDAWLLMVAWVPPGGEASAGGTGLLVAAAPVALGDVRCPATGNGSKPGYDLASEYGKKAADTAGDEIRDQIADGALGTWEGMTGSARNVAERLKSLGELVGKLGKLIDIAKAAQVMVNVDFAVDAAPTSTHRAHSTEREEPEDKAVQITVKATFLGVTSATDAGCAFAGMLGLPDPNTPIEGAQVSLDLDDILAGHGTVRRRQSQLSYRASTDEKGEYIAWYEPKVEKPDSAQKLSDAFIQKAQGTFTISVTWGTALGQLFNIFGGADLLLDILGLNEIQGEITVGWHDPAAEFLVEAPLVGFSGNRAYYLRTCDGVTWTGAALANGTLTTPDGKMTMTVDSDLEVVIPAGSNVGESPVLIETDLDGKIADATLKAFKTETGTLRLELGDDGTATLTVDLREGSQDLVISTPDGGAELKDQPVEPSTETLTAALRPASCDE
jgi:hypothetical protein